MAFPRWPRIKKQLEERKQAITNTDGGAEERASNISRSLIGKIV